MTSARRPITIGTAGHVDHGKTALVRALTGGDTDRLTEEKRRGLTIELGFAELELTDGRRLSVIDVPGHERFVRTMVAGATGIDLYLLCVAADDGVMPQTREHWAVLSALGVDKGVVALTKCDLVDRGQLARARVDVAELVGEVPMVEVSAKRGEGLKDLREHLEAVARALPTRGGDEPWPPAGPVLHIDRAFSPPGVGTVVTGTLWSGALSRGDRVKLLPSGRRARIRRVQVHGREAQRVEAGGRVALNLSGVSLGQVARGDVIAGPESRLSPTCRLGVELSLAHGSPQLDGKRLQVHHGTRDVSARGLALVEEEALYQLRLEAPLVTRAGDRLVIRQISPSDTLGGAVVIDPAPLPQNRRAAAKRLSLIRSGKPAALLEAALREHPSGIARDPSLWTAVPVLSGALRRFTPARWEEAIGEVVASGRAALSNGRLVEAESTAARAARLGEPSPPALSPLASAALELLRADRAKPRAPQALADALEIDHRAAIDALEELTAAGKLVRVKPKIYYPSEELARLRERVLASMDERGSISIAELRDHLAIGRKHAQALLEYLDARHDTLRRGDLHVRRRAPEDTRVRRGGRQESGGSAGLQSQ